MRQNPYHRWGSNFDNTGRAMQSGYGNVNIQRRHTNIQKGVQQNGIGHKNIQKDEFGWRRGRANTADVQENVKQNGIGKWNDKSLRRINEMMTNVFNVGSGKKYKGGKPGRHGNRRNGSKKQAKPSRRNQTQKEQQRNMNQIETSKKGSKTFSEQVEALMPFLCKRIKTLCDTSDRPTRRALNKTDIGTDTRSDQSFTQSASKIRHYQRHPRFIDEYYEDFTKL